MLVGSSRTDQPMHCNGAQIYLSFADSLHLRLLILIIDLCLTWEIMFAPSTHRRTVEKAYFDGKLIKKKPSILLWLQWWGFAQCSLFFCLSFTIHLENSPCLPEKFTLPPFSPGFPDGSNQAVLVMMNLFQHFFHLQLFSYFPPHGSNKAVFAHV